MKRHLLFFAVTAMLSISSNCLSAEDKLFDKLDTNRDGSISKEEFVNSDIVIVTRKDGKKHLHHRDLISAGEAAALSEMQKRMFWEHADQNKDGKIDRKEWSRASPDGFVLWRF